MVLKGARRLRPAPHVSLPNVRGCSRPTQETAICEVHSVAHPDALRLLGGQVTSVGATDARYGQAFEWFGRCDRRRFTEIDYAEAPVHVSLARGLQSCWPQRGRPGVLRPGLHAGSQHANARSGIISLGTGTTHSSLTTFSRVA